MKRLAIILLFVVMASIASNVLYYHWLLNRSIQDPKQPEIEQVDSLHSEIPEIFQFVNDSSSMVIGYTDSVTIGRNSVAMPLGAHIICPDTTLLGYSCCGDEPDTNLIFNDPVYYNGFHYEGGGDFVSIKDSTVIWQFKIDSANIMNLINPPRWIYKYIPMPNNEWIDTQTGLITNKFPGKNYKITLN